MRPGARRRQRRCLIGAARVPRVLRRCVGQAWDKNTADADFRELRMLARAGREMLTESAYSARHGLYEQLTRTVVGGPYI